MVKPRKRLSYEASYRNFILLRACIFILRIGGIGGYCFAVIFPSVYVLSQSIANRPQMLFAFVIPFGFLLFASIACIDVRRYGQEIVRLLSGNFLVKTGRVISKNQNVYTIGPVHSKKKQAKFEHFSYPNFYIRDKNCESDFQIGDYIKIVYPCAPRLNVRAARQLYAIYAFSSDETYSIRTRKATDKERKKTKFLFLSAVVLLSTALLSVLFVLISALLKQIQVYP